MNGTDIRKHIITLLIGIIITSIYNKYNDISKNNDSILISNEKLEQFDKRITKLEDDNRKLGDVYVTRREFNIILENIDTKLSNVSMNVNNMQVSTQAINEKLDKLTEKLYQK